MPVDGHNRKLADLSLTRVPAQEVPLKHGIGCELNVAGVIRPVDGEFLRSRCRWEPHQSSDEKHLEPSHHSFPRRFRRFILAFNGVGRTLQHHPRRSRFAKRRRVHAGVSLYSQPARMRCWIASSLTGAHSRDGARPPVPGGVPYRPADREARDQPTHPRCRAI